MKNVKLIVFTITIFAATVCFGSVEAVRAQSGSMEWRGTVDNVVQISIRNRNARTRILLGNPYNDDNFSFNGRAPRQNVDIRVDKRDGRGKVFIVQQPNRRNNFTTIVQISDEKGGADRYRFTLYWN